MEILLYLTLILGVLPLALGLLLSRPGLGAAELASGLASILQCALAFNLTFFWQELWLVIPKALTPGLHPVLFHNNHDWTGTSKLTELLQGTGAVATLASGLAFSCMLALARRASPIWRLFFFWMAFQGLFQSLTQLAIGSLLSGNDVGRALAYLGLSEAAKIALLALAAIAMTFAGSWLARRFPEDTTGAMAYSALGSVILIIPFRVPRDAIEVVLVPLIINLIGTGWLVLGGAFAGRYPTSRNLVGRSEAIAGQDPQRKSILGPALALCVTLFFFQLVLRPGVRF